MRASVCVCVFVCARACVHGYSAALAAAVAFSRKDDRSLPQKIYHSKWRLNELLKRNSNDSVVKYFLISFSIPKFKPAFLKQNYVLRRTVPLRFPDVAHKRQLTSKV